MTRQETLRFLILHTLGNFLVIVALFGVVMTFGPALLYELQYQVILLRHVQFEIKVSEVAEAPRISREHNQKSASDTIGTFASSAIAPKAPGFVDILAGSKEQILIPIDPLFSILIPKLGIDEQVVPNVNPDNPADYLPVLQHSVAHARGSVFPGDNGTIYLFAHSTDNWWDVGRYNAVFYTLSNLSPGDEIVLFYENKRYDYVVTKQVISDPQDTTYLTEEHAGPEQLVLQTCWPPGTAWKRLYVVAKPKSV